MGEILFLNEHDSYKKELEARKQNMLEGIEDLRKMVEDGEVTSFIMTTYDLDGATNIYTSRGTTLRQMSVMADHLKFLAMDETYNIDD